MALSVEEIERRKIARNARNRTYHTRRKELWAAEEEGKARIEAQVKERVDAATAAEKSIESERNAALAEIDRKIADLHDLRTVVVDDYSRKDRAAREITRAIYEEKFVLERTLDQTLDEKFPDLVGPARWSAGAWKPPS